MTNGKEIKNQFVDSLNEQASVFRKNLVACEELVSGDRIGLSQFEIQENMKSGRMFGLEVDGKIFYPSFFNTTDLDAKQLGDVCQILEYLSGAEKWQFFATPKNSLAGNPGLTTKFHIGAWVENLFLGSELHDKFRWNDDGDKLSARGFYESKL